VNGVEPSAEKIWRFKINEFWSYRKKKHASNTPFFENQLSRLFQLSPAEMKSDSPSPWRSKLPPEPAARGPRRRLTPDGQRAAGNPQHRGGSWRSRVRSSFYDMRSLVVRRRQILQIACYEIGQLGGSVALKTDNPMINSACDSHQGTHSSHRLPENRTGSRSIDGGENVGWAATIPHVLPSHQGRAPSRPSRRHRGGVAPAVDRTSLSE